MLKRFGTTLVVSASVTLMTVACASEGSGGGGGTGANGSGGPIVGQSCMTDGNEACSGTKVLQCNTDTGSLAWNVKKDCADTGRVCVTVSGTDADCS